MTIGKRVYIKSARTRAKTGKKYFRVKPKRKYGRKTYTGTRMRTIQPITRRMLSTVVKHQYQNTAKLDAIAWSELYTLQAGQQRNVNQRFSLNSIQVFAPGGLNGTARTGNDVVEYFKYGKPASDNYTANQATTMPGFLDVAPYLKSNYNHYQVLGTKITLTFRAIHSDTSAETGSQVLPLRINISRVSSDIGSITATRSTEDILKLPYTQSKVIMGLDATANKSCTFNISHSPAKFNGIRKGQFVGDSRYLAQSTATQISDGNVPEEEDFLIVSVSPLSSQFAENTPLTVKTPVIYMTMKMDKWVKYTDPTLLNHMGE